MKFLRTSQEGLSCTRAALHVAMWMNQSYYFSLIHEPPYNLSQILAIQLPHHLWIPRGTEPSVVHWAVEGCSVSLVHKLPIELELHP